MVLQGGMLKCQLASLFFGELIMALGNGSINSVGATKKYNQLLVPK